MSDPGTIVGLLSLGIQACDGLVGYYLKWKDCQKDIRVTISLLNNLRDGLNAVQKLVDGGSPDAIKLVDGISSCSAAINELSVELASFEPYKHSDSLRNKLKTQARRLYYPFKESTLAKLREHVFEVKEVLDLSMGTLQLERLEVVVDVVEDSNRLIRSIQRRILDSETRTWLAAPNPSTNQVAAREKRHARTGSWFIHNPLFEFWEKESDSFLWLQGFAGCGKTILSSTIIHHATRYATSKPNTAAVFFYFDFTDTAKQTPEGLFRSLIAQLSEQASRSPKVLFDLYRMYRNSTAPIEALVGTSKDLIEEFQEVFIVIDALDECRDRTKLLDGINALRNPPNGRLHLLVTSRREEDLVVGLKPADDEVFSLQVREVDDDIRDFIVERLREDSLMQKWENHHDEIEEALVHGASGMFRWVDCHLSTLRTCRNLPMLRKALGSLPKTLDETYENILKNIDPGDQPYALRILEFVCFSAYPPTIEEVNDALAIELDGKPRFDPESRFLTAEDILYVCPSLLTLTEQEKRKGSNYSMSRIVQLAHFSVKEYLVSERIAESTVSPFALSPQRGHEMLCRKCLAYLDYLGEHENLSKDNVNNFPLARYAAENWSYHYKQYPLVSSAIQPILDFLTVKEDVFLAWFRLFDPQGEWLGPNFKREIPKGPYALYYASYLGLEPIVQWMLESLGPRINDNVISDLGNGRTVRSTALCGAIDRGHRAIVKMLLDCGANVHIRDRTGTPLAIAVTTAEKDSEIINMLIKAGASINDTNFQGLTVLHLATFINDDNTEVIELLLQHGANVSAIDYEGRTALLRACGRSVSCPQRIKLLLAAGSDAFHHDRYCQTALGIYSLKFLQRNFRNRDLDSLLNYLFEHTPGSQELSELLSTRATDGTNFLEGFLILFESVKAKTTITSVIASAVFHGSYMMNDSSLEVIRDRLLYKELEKWLDCHNFNSVLYAMSHERQPKALRVLLKNSGNLDLYNHGLEQVLVHSSFLGDLESVTLLLQFGADPNCIVYTSVSEGLSPLLVAAKWGQVEIVKLLIAYGVDCRLQDGNEDTAMHLAARNGKLDVVELLSNQYPGCLEVKNKRGEDCLLSAASSGRTEVVRWLLDQKDITSRPEKVEVVLAKARESLQNARLDSNRDGYEDRLEGLVEYLSTISTRIEI